MSSSKSRIIDIDESRKVEKVAERRKEYHKTWAKDKAQISIRIPIDLKTIIDAHVSSRNEKLAAFVVRAIKNQIEKDNDTIK